MTIKGKSIIITGASTGLGAALAMKAAEEGCYLTLCARRKDRLDKTKALILDRYKDSQVITVECDVTNKDAMHHVVELCAARFGGVDIFIANAGQSMWSRFSDIEDPDRLKEMMDLNFMGVVNGAFYALPYLRSSQGSFVAISSIQGAIPVPYHSGYVASKYAVNGFIETLGLEEPHVHFLLAMPSWISSTELRSSALTGTKEGSISVKQSHGRSALTPAQCAQSIIDALKAKKTDLYMPNIYSLVPLLRKLFRNTVDKVIKNKVNTQVTSKV